MSNKIPKPNEKKSSNHSYDLEERTAVFSENIVQFCKEIPDTTINRPMIHQLIKSGTSVGANYCEADDAETKKDFVHKIGLCKKEARETKHWLRVLVVSEPKLKNEAKVLWQEAKELNLIFNSIIHSSKKNK